MQTKFLLICGVSGVGKSSIIRNLKSVDKRFVYIRPYTTRKIRYGEIDKVNVSETILKSMYANGDFLILNKLYGNIYATPLHQILQSLENNLFPVLDCPINRVKFINRILKSKVFCVYVKPESIEQLVKHIKHDGRDNIDKRIQRAIVELDEFEERRFNSLIDIALINNEGRLKTVSETIYSFYIKDIE